MGLLDDIFGGTSAGAGFDATQVPILTGPQGDLLDQLVKMLSGQLGQGITPYGGQRIAGVSPLQEMGFGLAPGFAGGIGAGMGGFADVLGQFDPMQGGQFLGQAGELLGQATQPFDPQTILDALAPGRQLAQNVFQQETVPFLAERFGATSGASGSLNRALSEAGANLSLGLGAQAAPYLFQGQQAQLGRQLQGAGMAGNLAQLPGAIAGQGMGLGANALDLIGGLTNLGGVQRGISQQGLSAEQQKFNEAQAFANPWLNFMPTALGTSAFTTVLDPRGQGIGSALLPGLGSFFGEKGFQGGMTDILGGLGAIGGAAGGLLGGLGSLFCDRRLKQNIVPIEDACEKMEHLNGATYNYLNKPTERDGGIMAQDLEEVLPEGVIEFNGIKMVKLDAVMGLIVNAVNELNDRVKQLEA